MDPLISASELADRLGEPGLVIADVRWYLDGRRGIDAYVEGHLPGAIFVDLDRDLAAPVAHDGHGGRHPLPSPEDFASSMRSLGVTDDSVVVAYDDAAGSIAARLWWMLHATGRHALVLDGGIGAWEGALDSGPPRRQASAGAAFTARPWPSDRFVDAAFVDRARRSPSTGVVLDARAAARYQGEHEPVDRTAGHIPGALNVPWIDLVDGGKLRRPADLRSLLPQPQDDEAVLVASCGSGVTACHLLLAATRAGIPDHRLRLYPGSWSDWCSDPDRPIATGGEPDGRTD